MKDVNADTEEKDGSTTMGHKENGDQKRQRQIMKERGKRRQSST